MKSIRSIFFVTVFIACLPQFASDVYAPSLPRIAEVFGSSIDLVQWSMAIFMLGVGLSQLVYGPISEAVGRKPPLVVGTIIMLLGSIFCYLTPSVKLLIWGRFIQGIGAGSVSAITRPILRDLFKGEDLAKYGSYFAMTITFIIPTAPVIGGLLQEHYDFRASFLFMVGYSFLATLALLWGYRETNVHKDRSKLALNHVVKSYTTLLKNQIFIGSSMAVFFTYGAFFAWFVAGPVLLIKLLGVPPEQFGWICFATILCAYLPAGLLNARLVKRFGSIKMMRFGWIVMFLASLALTLLSYFPIHLFTVIIPIGFFYFGALFIFPNAFAIAFTPFGHMAGYAGALYGSLQILGGSILGAIISFLPDHSQLYLGITMLLAVILSVFFFEILARKKVEETGG